MNTEAVKPTTFLRKGAALDFKPMVVKENETKFVEIISPKISEIFLKNKGENVPAISVKDLEAGTTNILWLSGRLLQLTKVMQLSGPLNGRRLEIKNAGTETAEVDGVTWDMNKYEVYELQ